MHNDGRIIHIKDLYQKVIKKLCFKHHMEILPNYFSSNIMPHLNTNQLQNRITRISLEQMYDYRLDVKSPKICFKKVCCELWNSLPLNIKMLPYSNKINAMKEFNRFLSNSSA